MSSEVSQVRVAKKPPLFEQFFELGSHDSVSPFITPESRSWGKDLSLKASIFSAFLLLGAFLLSFLPQWQPISNIFLLGVYFFVGLPSLIESLEDLGDFQVNIDVLMTLAAFSSVLIGSGLEGGLLLVLFAISHAMEDAVRSKAKSAISSLHKLSPTCATVVGEDGLLVERAISEITVGTKILVKSDQVIPLDGEVLEGTSSVNLVHITGENFPVRKQPGDDVQAGARNLEGALTIEVHRISSDSTLARIIQLVTQAQDAKPKLQQWFQKLSRRYATTIILLAAFFSLTFPFIFSIPFFGVDGSIYRSLAFLIAASPCALIIAIPIAYLSAISVCARRGILLKGGITLDAISQCKAFAFDKTGTLTTGDLNLILIEQVGHNEDVKVAFDVAYAMERNAVHPIAKAILNHDQKAEKVHLTDYKSIPGYGLEAIAHLDSGDQAAYIGHPDFIMDKLPRHQSDLLSQRSEKIKKEGMLLAVLLLGESLYLFQFSDTPRQKVRKTLQKLRDHWKLKLVMLTGDHEESAKRIAKELNLDDYRANLRPEHKLEIVGKIAQETPLAMVGDGVNDAPALARATVGIGMGKVGTTAAIDASDVILLHDNVELLDWLFGKAIKTQRIVKQNLTLATAAILFASIPALSGIVPLWLAVILHEGGTVLVGLNALRLLRD